MDYSWINSPLWNPIISFGILSGIMLLSNLLLRKISIFRKTLLPTAVLTGFIVLTLRETGLLPIRAEFLEMVTYHTIALGFIAMGLRVPNKNDPEFQKELTGAKSGALIVGCYLIQGILGLLITIGLAYTVMPGLFKAAGILLPMGYGQGSGQANNIGSTYEQLGFIGGQSFGLSIAAAGYLCACVVGIIYLNVLRRKNIIQTETADFLSGSVSIDTFQMENEIPISESVDRFSVQAALVILVYMATYFIIRGVTAFLSAAAPGLAGMLNPLFWGFNFIFGALLAMLCGVCFRWLTKKRVMTHQYPNNYLLSRLSGALFDVMIICGIAAIDISDLSGLWLPFLLMAVLGGVVTILYLIWVCKIIYPDYYYEGFFSMFGMMTGTISSGILLLRELDPYFKTPAANNLLTGSGFAIAFGGPILILIGLAPQSTTLLFLTMAIMVVYFVLLMLFITKVRRRKKPEEDTNP